MSDNIKLEVVLFESKRDIKPVREAGGIEDLAIGKTTCTVYVRGPSGRVYVLDAPSELLDELAEKWDQQH